MRSALTEAGLLQKGVSCRLCLHPVCVQRDITTALVQSRVLAHIPLRRLSKYKDLCQPPLCHLSLLDQYLRTHLEAEYQQFLGI